MNQSSTAVSSDLQAIESLAADLGYEVIDIEHSSGGLLRVYIDMPEADRLINVQDCERVSNHLIHGLPVMGIDFQRLEVSSPGMDRRLTKAKHFRQFLGCEVKLKLRQGVSGRKNFQGQLAPAEDFVPKASNASNASNASTASHQDERFFLIFQADDGSEQQLDFLVSDIDLARLVPQLPFKERRP
jgi:ribosome maturation factor RimP